MEEVPLSQPAFTKEVFQLIPCFEIRRCHEITPSTDRPQNQAPFFNLPPELRNEVYAMAIADMPLAQDLDHPVGEFNLCQPALARVNRQLRSEVLPMWYGARRSFGICIHPRWHSEADQAWQGFVDRFQAHAAGADGSHHLSCIRRLQVELWHPAFGPGLLRKTSRFFFDRRNGVYIHFGPLATSFPDRAGVRVDITDWTDRHTVRARIRASIVETRHEQYIDRLCRFFGTFPFERLVDLVMMVAAECKEAARFVHIATSFAPTSVSCADLELLEMMSSLELRRRATIN